MTRVTGELDIVETSELLQKLDDPMVQLIDVRPVDAYNGWRLRGESRGGHVRGARSFPASWLDYIDWIEAVEDKGFAHDNELVLYGYDREDIDRVAHGLHRAGFKKLSVYPDFLEAWVPDEDLPMDRMKRYKNLVPASWLHGLLEKGSAHEMDSSRYVLCHCHYRNIEDYKLGHIPGAVALDTNTLESQDTWNRRSAAEIKSALEQSGITRDTTVIVYGRFSYPDNNDPFPGSSSGHLGAMRCAFILLYAGVEDVRILNGGLHSWLAAGYDLETEERAPKNVPDFGGHIPGRPEIAVDLEDAVNILQDDDKNLVSVRSWSEYIGEVSGYNYIEKKGRIPGSVFANCGSDAYHMENYRNLDHTTREYHEIEDLWRGAGITPDKLNAFYCGTGWRGSEAFINAWLMGWPRIALFDGGWFEWSNSDYPFETGEPPVK